MSINKRLDAIETRLDAIEAMLEETLDAIEAILEEIKQTIGTNKIRHIPGTMPCPNPYCTTPFPHKGVCRPSGWWYGTTTTKLSSIPPEPLA